MDRLITNNHGGKHLTTNDLGFMQGATAEALKHVLTGLGLGSQTFILSGCQLTPTSDSLSVAAGAMSFMGESVPVPAQTASGSGDLSKYWFVVNSQTGHPRNYFDGLARDTQEYRAAKLVYSEDQPAGGISVASVVVWSQRFYDIIVADKIPTSLPANGGNADTLDGKHASDLATNTQGEKADSAVQSATIGGVGVVKSGTQLQLPAYTTGHDLSKYMVLSAGANDVNWTSFDYSKLTRIVITAKLLELSYFSVNESIDIVPFGFVMEVINLSSTDDVGIRVNHRIGSSTFFAEVEKSKYRKMIFLSESTTSGMRGQWRTVAYNDITTLR